jgi:hypothetical protein
MSNNVKLSTACLTSLFASWLLATTATISAPLDETYTVTGIVQICTSAETCENEKLPGVQSLTTGGTDISWDDPGSHTYALTDRTNKSIDIVNTRSNKLKQLHPTPPFAGIVATAQSSGPNGVVIVEHRDVWATDGPVQPCSGTAPNMTCTKPGSVKVIDLKTGATKAVIYPPGGHGRVDELCFNPRSDVVLAASNATAGFGDAFLTFIDEDSFKPVGQIFLDGSINAAVNPNDKTHIKATGIEQCQSNPRDGKFYLSLVDIGGGKGGHDGAVLRISGHAPFEVEAVLPIDSATTGCKGPAGLTIGPAHQIAVGCNGTSKASLIIDDRYDTTTIIQPVKTTSGVDEIWYDPGSNHYFFAQSTPGVMAVEDAGNGKSAPSPDSDVTTAVGNKNPAVDPLRNQVYLPILANTSTICSTHKDAYGNPGDDTKGCIAIYTGPLDKDDCLAEGEAVIAVDEEGDAEHRKVRCDRD